MRPNGIELRPELPWECALIAPNLVSNWHRIGIEPDLYRGPSPLPTPVELHPDAAPIAPDCGPSPLPAGVVLAIAALHGWSSRKLQVCGFALMAAACLALAAAAKLGADETTKFALFCVVLFAINWGPNVSTYCLPAEVFPTAVRSSCFGVCAGMGKVGAIIGAASFEAINTALGLQGVYLICAVVSIAGLLVTVAFVPTEVEVTEGEASGSLEPAAAAAPFEQSPASSIQSSLLPPAHKHGGASA